MERLTQRCGCGICGSNKKVILYPLYKIGGDEYMDHGLINQCFEKLAMYEDLEEQGLLFRLPCKVGDTVYRLFHVNGIPYVVQSMPVRMLSQVIRIMEDDAFNKTVFLTRADAEAALEKMKGEEHEINQNN